MMNRFQKVTVRTGLVLAALCMAGTANAAMVTHTFNFSATNFFQIYGPSAPPPVSTITGSLTVRFDNSVTQIDNTNQITLDNINVPIDSQISYTYIILLPHPVMLLGGISGGSGSFTGVQNDFGIAISDLGGGNFHAGSAFYSASSGHAWQSDEGSNPGSIHLSVTSGAAIPEPATWALMLTGFGLVGAGLRRRGSVRVRFAG